MWALMPMFRVLSRLASSREASVHTDRFPHQPHAAAPAAAGDVDGVAAGSEQAFLPRHLLTRKWAPEHWREVPPSRRPGASTKRALKLSPRVDLRAGQTIDIARRALRVEAYHLHPRSKGRPATNFSHAARPLGRLPQGSQGGPLSAGRHSQSFFLSSLLKTCGLPLLEDLFRFVGQMAEVYAQAAAVLQQLDAKGLGLRAALYGEAKPPPEALPRVYALVSKTLPERELLQRLLRDVGLLSAHPAAPPEEPTVKKRAARKDYLLLLMLRDMLLSPKGIEGGGQLKRELLQHEERLRRLYSAARPLRRDKAGAMATTTAATATAAAIPRYLRVNLRLWSRPEAAELLKKRLPPEMWVRQDPLIPSVIAVPGAAARLLQQQPEQQSLQQSEWNERPQLHQLVSEGWVALQDRASCCAAAAAAVCPGDVVVDACAAPGSKTLHILDCLGSKGHLIALEKHEGRRAILLRRLLVEGRLKGPFTSPTCTHQYKVSSSSGTGTDNSCSRTGSSCENACSNSGGNSSSSSDNERFLHFARLAAKRPLYLARAEDDARDCDTSAAAVPAPAAAERSPAAAAASYPKVAALLPSLLVEVRGIDFAAVDGTAPPFCFAQKILLDPSCSGSGLPTHQPSAVAIPAAVKPATADGGASEEGISLQQWSWESWRGDHLHGLSTGEASKRLPTVTPPPTQDRRVSRLAALQQKLLLHALTAFPAARAVCYSTCSLYVQENESVLLSLGLHKQQQLQQRSQQPQQQQARLSTWRVCRPPLHAGWFPTASAVSQLVQQIESSTSGSNNSSTTRQLQEALQQFGPLCVRATPETHKCRGFFLAAIQRTELQPPLAPAAALKATATSAAAAGTSAGGKRAGRGKRKKLDRGQESDAHAPARRGRLGPLRNIRSCTKAGINV
ncbi:hypothetical protein Emag_003170 [Eimeria magna]